MPLDVSHRVRILAAILLCAGAVWTGWLVGETISAPTLIGHHDFFAIYAAGTLIRTHQAQALYDPSALTAIERHILPVPVGAAGYMAYLNPPAAAAAIAPLTYLPEPVARLVWLIISLGLGVACGLLATTGLGLRIRLLAITMVMLSFPMFQTLAEGQSSLVLLLGALGALVLARRRHPHLSGAILALLWLKAQLLVLALIWLLLLRRWRIVVSAIITVIVVTLLALPLTGSASNVDYFRFLGSVAVSHASGAGAVTPTAWEGGLLGMENLLGLFATVVGQEHVTLVDVLTVASSIALVVYFLAATGRRWRRGEVTEFDGIAAVAVALLIDPHLYAQDCLLLVLMLAVGLRSIRSESDQAMLIVACVGLMDLAVLDTVWTTGMPLRPPHLLTIALIGVVLLLSRTSKASPTGPALRWLFRFMRHGAAVPLGSGQIPSGALALKTAVNLPITIAGFGGDERQSNPPLTPQQRPSNDCAPRSALAGAAKGHAGQPMYFGPTH
ncbi:MAG TPA: glycosyltransferase family 87 protein [Candidatus Micrarchaeaceae archaeon]|nr:glycosyltransferase family 87 protein [Candidatus Micrarchaeaceae archaeon]